MLMFDNNTAPGFHVTTHCALCCEELADRDVADRDGDARFCGTCVAGYSEGVPLAVDDAEETTPLPRETMSMIVFGRAA